ncbi:hypothetical protein GOP47_0021098 [Adiantum capillus-veneris]|uniref:Uncharacterized protein n=1 Tax=Adiantum capillus-veneris TaxID=13818 RepID=A0A9D4UBE6_ADICA|nr:hypothetical protein GOP47_0021098 [Adiantum capillus-veneris]
MMMGAGDQHSTPAPARSSAEINLYLSTGCLSASESYAKDAHSGALLFSLSVPGFCGSGSPVLSDAHGAPLLHYTEKGSMLSSKVDVFKGDAGEGGALAFTVKEKSSLFSQIFHIFMAGSPSDGPPDYTLKPASNSLKIFRNDVVVAKAKGGSLFSKVDYQITVFLDIDQAMAVLLVAIYDDKRPKSS